MSMDQTRFENLVKRMERLAKDEPSAYRRRVIGLAALGYTYLVFVVLALLVLTALSAWFVTYSAIAGTKLFLIVGALLIVVLRALWVRLTPPGGEKVSRSEAPALFAMLDQLRARLNTPPVHEVLVTSEFNAAVTQVPRLGLFGWHRNYLLIGLPLMKGLTAQQFEAVLAHELGHLSRGHARAANWIYRLRLIWARLEDALDESPQWGAGLIRAFYKWYIPYFRACSFPLARANEYEADATSAALTSARSAAQALTSVNVIGSYLSERYWPGIHAAARDTAQPSFAPYTGLNARVLEQISPGDAKRWLSAALTRTTTYADTHPSLTDRLSAIGAAAEICLPAPGAGADQLLGESKRASLDAEFDTDWRNRIASSWEQYHRETKANRERLAVLRAKASQELLDAPEGLEHARLEEDVGTGSVTALALRRTLAKRMPDSVPVRFALARQLLMQGEEEGIGLMEALIGEDSDVILPGSELLRDYWWERGDRQRADEWHARYVQRANLLHEAQLERDTATLTDRWLPHGLDEATLQALLSQLKQFEGLRRAYLVRKDVRHFPEHPLYVLGFRVAFGWGRPARAAALLEQLRTRLQLPGETFLISLEGVNDRFKRKFWRHRNARIL